MTKTNYDQLENFKRIEKRSVNPIAAFDHTYMKGKLGQNSVNGLLNNLSSVNPLQLPDIMEIDSLRGKTFWRKNQSR